MILLMQSLNEEEYVPRVMADIMTMDFFHRIIVIDGGSTDYTREALKETTNGKAEIFVHPWLDWYHDMNICQRNVGLSYIPHGELCFILDFDERISQPLVEFLEKDSVKIQGTNKPFLGMVARRTFEVMRHPDTPYAVLENDWPIPIQQTGQYPDYQPRYILKHPSMRWINSPHHVLIGEYVTCHVNFDIIHFEKNDSRHRFRIEKKWAREQATRKALGLSADAFETRVKPEVEKWSNPDSWR